MWHRVMLLVTVMSTAGVMPIPQCGSEPGPTGEAIVLRLARSGDGLAFTDSGEVLPGDVSALRLVRLSNGHLLAVFDYASEVWGVARVTASSASADDGRTWSEPRAVRVVDDQGRPMSVGARALARGTDGIVRLYLVGRNPQPGSRPAESQPASAPAGQLAIYTAATRDGVEFRVDGVAALVPQPAGAVELAAVDSDKRVDLYVWTSEDAGKNADKRAGGLRHLVSTDGRRFKPQEPAQDQGFVAADSIVALKQGYRAYVSAGDGVRSMVSQDGARWKHEEGVRLAGGRNAVVVRLNDGSYLMLYRAKADALSRHLPRVGNQPSAGAMGEADSDNGRPAETAAVVIDGKDESGKQGGEQAASGDPLNGSIKNDGRNEGIYTSREGSGSGQEGADAVAGDASNESIEQVIENLMPPQPDFVNPVDYLSWMKEQFPPDVENNAYDAYKAILPFFTIPLTDEPEQEPDWWPKSFNDAFYADKPGPWLPEEHPDWEATHQLLQWPLSEFRDATLLPNYATPFTFGRQAANDPDQRPLVWELLLPGMTSSRTMAKAALADAWRVENGRIDPGRMTEAWKTCLGNADHMAKGFALIQQLVAIAEQNLVQEQARLALKHDVFQSADDLERALNVLKDHDRNRSSVPTWVSCETAAGLDTTQYLFTPASPDGQPQINLDRVKRVLPGLNGSPAKQEDVDRFAKMGPEDAYKTIDALDEYCRELTRKWHVGYPQVRQADMAALEMKTAHTTEITKVFLPSVSRAYQLTARNETSRRATQLTYEVHLFKARNGRWPASLDELPLPAGDRSRIDPFTGSGFGYRLTDTGPTIYSMSENGRDDGGVHSPHWADNVKSDADSDDYVFWPPQ